MYRFNFAPILEQSDLIFKAIGMTLLITVVSMVLAVVLGLLVAVCRLSRSRVLSILARSYVQLFRGIPLYVYIIWLYYGLALLLGITFSPFQAGVICLATLYGAYLAEVDRGALVSIPKEQTEAALALGLTPLQTLRRVVLPQAARRAIPPTTNLFAVMLMDSSLVSVIGVMDLMRFVRVGASESFRALEFYTIAAVIYIGIVLIITRSSRFLERRFC